MQFLAKFSLAAAAATWLLGALAAPTNRTRTLAARAGGNIYSQCSQPNTVALTFDDGAHKYSDLIRQALNAAGAKGTFVVNEDNFGCIYEPANVQRIRDSYDDGHQYISHTGGHLHLTQLNWDQIHHEFWRVELALKRILGVETPFVRPPYGEINQLVKDVAANRGKDLVLWDFDSQDSMGASPDESISLYDVIIRHHPSNILALNHETVETTAKQVLGDVIPKLQAAGYKLVTLAECLGLPAYTSVGNRGTPDDSWQCLGPRSP